MAGDILILTSQFNEVITKALKEGAVGELESHGVTYDTMEVSGAFELPLVAKKAAASGRYQGVVCLGAVIRGETPHFDYVCASAASGIMNASLETGVPITFGVLTTDTVEQALNRCGIKSGNKGRDAVRTTLHTIRTLKRFD